jgi:hypothetical protein
MENMPSNKKSTKKKHGALKNIPDADLPDPDKSPFFIKQLELAKAMLKKHPIPVELLRSK